MEDPAPLVAVVDDEHAIRKALTRLLRSASYEVESFASGQEFLKSLAMRYPACLVLDICMHGMTGLEVQAWLKEQNLALPIVFITALDDRADQALAMKRGATALLR